MFRKCAINAALLMVLSLASATCGGGGGPSNPSSPPSNAIVSPTNFRIVLQRVLFTSNEVQVSWAGSGSTYRVSAGATSNGTELLNADVTGTSYTWNAPRTEGVFYVRVAATQGTATSSPVELPVFTIDLRNVIDALFFGRGPMSQNTGGRDNPFAAIWPDNTRLTVRASAESGDTARANAQTYVNDYEGLGGGISAGVEVTPDDMKSWVLQNVPTLTIALRVLNSGCGGQSGVIACANIGPAPVGQNRSIVNMVGTGGGMSIAHELGHAYGMQHVLVNSSVRQELNFMMNPALISSQMTEPEKNAIRAARDGGLRPGMTRSQAEALGLVRPYASIEFSTTSGYSSLVNRAPSRCTILDNR